MKQDPRQHRKMWVAVGISLLVVLGIWALQLKQTVFRVRPERLGDDVRTEWEAVRNELDAVLGKGEEEEREGAPAQEGASENAAIDRAAVERLGEQLKHESP